MKGPTKSGYAAARSSNGTGRSNMAKPRKPQNKAERTFANVKRAEAELAAMIEEDDHPFVGDVIKVPRGGGMLGAAPPTEDGDDDVMDSRVVAQYEALRNMIGIENTDYNAEQAHRLLLRTIMSNLMNLIPKSIEVYNKTTKEQAGYVVAAFMTQARDVNSELRMGSDVDQQAAFIVNRIVSPVLTAVAQQILREGMALKNVVNEELPRAPKAAHAINERVNAFITDAARFIDASKEKTTADIQAYLSGDASFVNSETAGGKKSNRGGRRGAH